MVAAENELDLAAAGCTYIISVPSGDDIMLNYQTNSYQDILAVRQTLGLHPIKEFEQWMEKMGILENGQPTARTGDPTIFTEGRPLV